MAEEKKKTKREMYEEIKAVVAQNAEMVAFIDHEIDLLKKKSESSGKKASEEDMALQNAVLGVLTAADSPMTLSDMLKAPTLVSLYENKPKPLTTQKLTPLVAKLVEAKKVEMTTEKGRNYYSKA